MAASSHGPAPAAEGPRFTAINPDAFRDGFSVDVLLTYLARDVVKHKLASRAQLEGGTAPLVVRASQEKVQRLVGTLESAEEELKALQGEIGRKVGHLQSAIGRQEATYQAGVSEAEDVCERVRGAYKEVEGAANRISQVGIRIGDRLQTADAVRSRALELVALFSHLHAFSQLDMPSHDDSAPEDVFKELPEVFWDDKALAEAAGLAQKLTALTAEAHNAKQRSRLVNTDENDNTFGAKGSLNYTTWQLSGYCNWLEVRVLAKFDRASARGSARVMADCAAIMAKFNAERVLVQRYVESMPVFAEDDEYGSVPHVTPPAGPTAQQMASAMQPFNSLCDLLQATFEAEVHRLCEIFSNGMQALEMFMQRVASERLAPALQNLLLPPEMDSEDGQGRSCPRPSVKGAVAGGESSEEEEEEGETEDEGETGEDEEEEEGEGEGEGDIEQQIALALGRGSGDGRVMQRRKAAWGRRAPHVAESPELLAMRLKLLKQAHAHVMELSDAMEVAAAMAGVRGFNLTLLRDGLFTPYLANYPYPELRWLDMCYKVALSRQPHPQVDVALCEQLIANNREALARAEALAHGNQELCAAHVRLMFYGAGPFEELPGCLLAQLAHYIIDGVEHTLQIADIRDPAARAKAEVAAFYQAQEAFKAQAIAAAQAAIEAAAGRRGKNDPPPPEPPTPPPPVTRQSAAEKAERFVSTRLEAPLQATHGAAAIMSSLQSHFSEHVEARVSCALGELSECSSGVVLLMKAVEESISMVLHKVLDAVVIQAEVSLLVHQQRIDFFPEPFEPTSPTQMAESAATLPRPSPSATRITAPPRLAPGALFGLGQPTSACLAVCAQLAAVHRVASATLEGVNLNAFLHEVGLRMHSLLINHMQQYRYNAAGALRWKGDITEYVELMRGWEVAGLRDKLQGVQALANVLVVPPESLVGLVDAGLRLDHRAALQFVALREDYHTARVDGKSLQELFSSGSAVDDIISQVASARG